jgi:hypothetical protein
LPLDVLESTGTKRPLRGSLICLLQMVTAVTWTAADHPLGV